MRKTGAATLAMLNGHRADFKEKHPSPTTSSKSDKRRLARLSARFLPSEPSGVRVDSRRGRQVDEADQAAIRAAFRELNEMRKKA